MYLYKEDTKRLSQSDGSVKETYVVIGGHLRMRCMLYEPLILSEKSQIGIVLLHSDDDYSTFPIARALAERGYHVLAGQVSSPNGTLEQKLLDVKHAVEFLRMLDGISTVALLGHSGGATLMSAYQAVSEHGTDIMQEQSLLYRYRLTEALPPANGLMLLDSNFGNGAMTLISVDPAVVEEGNGIKLDPELDVFNPQNGYDTESPEYSPAFLSRFFTAQRERNNAIIRRAKDRLCLIEQGKGNYFDDEPFLVTGAAQMMFANKLIPQDTHLLAHTKAAYPLLHPNGSTSIEQIHCLRQPRKGQPQTPYLRGCVMSTVRSYLSNRAVLADADYRICEDGVNGILWDHAFTCTPGNVRFIEAPILIMGMTGSYEYLAAEAIFRNAASANKTIAFVEGAGHNFDAAGREAEFGCTEKRVYDACDRWLCDNLL